MMKTRENAWPNGLVLGILQFLIAIFCGSLIGVLAGAVNWTFVSLLRYPYSASMFAAFIGACIGVSFGFLLGIVAGLLPRGWPSGLLLSLLASVSASYWLISMNFHNLPSDLPALFLTAVIWFVSGWLAWLAVRKMVDEIRVSPRGNTAIAYYCALSIFYLALAGYWLFYYWSYREFHHRY
jgi:hypothetical protein